MEQSNRFQFQEILPPYCSRCKFGKCNGYFKCLHSVFDNIPKDNNYSGILVDPSFGNILLDAGKKYFHTLKSLCKERNICLIFDEVRTGLGRLGPMFAFEKYEIVPDIVCLSKAIAVGYPLSLTIYNGQDVSLRKKFTFHQQMESSFAGATLGLKLAEYVLNRVFKEKIGVNTLSDYMYMRLKELETYSTINEVRANGMIFAIEFVKPQSKEFSKSIAVKFLTYAFDKGILLDYPAYESVLLIHPFLNIDKETIDEVMMVFHNIMRQF